MVGYKCESARSFGHSGKPHDHVHLVLGSARFEEFHQVLRGNVFAPCREHAKPHKLAVILAQRARDEGQGGVAGIITCQKFWGSQRHEAMVGQQVAAFCFHGFKAFEGLNCVVGWHCDLLNGPLHWHDLSS